MCSQWHHKVGGGLQEVIEFKALQHRPQGNVASMCWWSCLVDTRIIQTPPTNPDEPRTSVLFRVIEGNHRVSYSCPVAADAVGGTKGMKGLTKIRAFYLICSSVKLPENILLDSYDVTTLLGWTPPGPVDLLQLLKRRPLFNWISLVMSRKK